MNVVIFRPGKAKSLVQYLDYFGLRFPFTWGTEETRELELVDTYDRRWSSSGQVWVRQGAALSLVPFPSLFSIDGAEPDLFGLQSPVSLGKMAVRVRSLVFSTPSGKSVDGMVVRIKARWYLVLQGRDGELWSTLVGALTSDGLEQVDQRAEAVHLFSGKPGFAGPTEFPNPALGDPAGPFLLERISDNLRVAFEYEKGIRSDVDTECLHRYRVNLRRARSLLAFGRMWESADPWPRLKEMLSKLMSWTNELRDLDVLLLDLPRLRDRLPWGEGARLAGWVSALRLRRNGEQKRVKAWLVSEEYAALTEGISALVDELRGAGEPWTLGDLRATVFQRASRTLRKTLNGVVPGCPDEVLHEVRIQTKKLRYVLETFGDLVPVDKVLPKTLRQAQESLGAFQDGTLRLERLKCEVDLVRSGKVHADLGSLALLVGFLARDHEDHRTRAASAAGRLRGGEFRRALEAVGGR